ncbi:MAG TPA: SDR family oxidoreductase [Candidatus Lustribacter sp.]|jgi:NAD(P)-dependent dehydrogenase (short-subunit alcohol dehydrogenase family)|nr:SDR family oxidoreductase [Candidatus Lustribacter sp.]
MRLAGKTAIVTGATGQFGHVIARAYAREGADVYLCEWPESAAAVQKLRDELKAAGHRAECGTHDVSTQAGAAELAAAVLKSFGQIDILLNGTSGGGHGRVFEIAEAAWRKTLDRGVTSYFFTCQQVGKEMARRGGGKIINISSIVGRIGAGGAVGWGANNGGIDAMTAALAQELGHYGINVVALARGATDTTPYPAEAKAERLRRLPFNRLGREDDIVGPAIFLATDEAAWIHGSVVYCDGGYVTAAATDAAYRPTEVPYRGQ